MHEKKMNIQQYKHLFCDKSKRGLLILGILQNNSYDDILKYVEATPNGFKSVYKKTLSYLLRKSFGEVYLGLRFEIEPLAFVGLMAYILPLFEDEVNLFVYLRNEFEKSYLYGDYDKASDILNEINSSISYSMWSAIQQIKIAGLQGGLEQSAKVGKSLYVEKRTVFNFLCNHAIDTSLIDADTELGIQTKLNTIRQNELPSWAEQYLLAKIVPMQQVGLGTWMSYELSASLVDVYVTFIQTLPLLVKEFADNHEFKRYLSILSSKIKDPWIQKAHLLLNESGDINMFRDFHNDYSMDFFKLYRDIANSESNQIHSDISSLYQQIKYHLTLYMRNIDADVHKSKLEMIIATNVNFMPFAQVRYILEDMSHSTLTSIARDYWQYSHNIDILDALFYENPNVRKRFVNNLVKVCNIKPSDKLDSIDTLQWLIVNEHLENYVEQFKECLTQDNLPLGSFSIVSAYVFDWYWQKKQYKEGISFYVEYSLKHPDVKILVDNKLVGYSITPQLMKNLGMSLELSIFFNLIGGENIKVVVNASRYLKEIGVDIPSNIRLQGGDEKTLFFMENVLNRNVLDLMFDYYSDEKAVIADRIKICQKLNQVNNYKKHNQEINLLLTELSIQQFMSQVEESKVDVDEILIRRNDLEEVKKFFTLYQDVKSKHIKVRSDDEDMRTLFEERYRENQPELVEVAYDYVLFVRIVKMMRDIFVLNEKAGLDYYLSSRVRHGTIMNQMRHPFIESDLITRKNDENQYEINKKWIDVLHVTDDKLNECINRFNKFSRNIDEIILNFKEINIQVCTEVNEKEKKGACFDFSMPKIVDDVYQLYLNGVESFDEFVNASFSILWKRTEECLKEVRTILSTIEQQFREELNSLRYDIETITGERNSNFEDAITSCMTAVQRDIQTVGKWFKRSKQSGASFKMSELIDASITGINNINIRQLSPDIQVQSTFLFPFRYVVPLYTMFNTILNNVLEYADGKTKVKCQIVVLEEKGVLNVKISNPIDDKREKLARQAIENFYAPKAPQDRIYNRTEGKSGLYKINNVVKYTLGDYHNIFKPFTENKNFINEIHINLNNLKEDENINN